MHMVVVRVRGGVYNDVRVIHQKHRYLPSHQPKKISDFIGDKKIPFQNVKLTSFPIAAHSSSAPRRRSNHSVKIFESPTPPRTHPADAPRAPACPSAAHARAQSTSARARPGFAVSSLSCPAPVRCARTQTARLHRASRACARRR